MGFEVLDARGPGRDRWKELLARLPPESRDIHFLPEYGDIYERSYGYTAHLAVHAEGEVFVLQPFVKRPLADLPFLAGNPGATRFFDIANAYGYGGPLSNARSLDDARALFGRFDRCFREWCVRERIASEFVSFHPLLRNHEIVEVTLDVHRAKSVVFADLSGGEDGLLAGLNRGCRSNVNRARKAGVTVERVEATAEALAGFHRMYLHTMERNGAEARWFFPERYFPDCCCALGPERSSLFAAKVGDEIASFHFLIHDGETAYYHFGASDESYFSARPNSLLMFEAMKWAAARGHSRFHLGGGVTSAPDDPLMRFKTGFSRETAPLFVSWRVHDPDTYGMLCEMKAGHERRTGVVPEDAGYFPMYRRKGRAAA